MHLDNKAESHGTANTDSGSTAESISGADTGLNDKLKAARLQLSNLLLCGILHEDD